MATLPVNVPDAQVPRVRTGVGRRLQLKDGQGVARDATTTEVSQYLADRLIECVYETEQAAAAESAKAAVTKITATP